jgi:hypothetical protein
LKEREREYTCARVLRVPFLTFFNEERRVSNAREEGKRGWFFSFFFLCSSS